MPGIQHWLRGRGPVHGCACVLLVAGVSACQDPTQPAPPRDEQAPPSYTHGMFTLSNGIYRIPYADGLEVRVTQDHHTHGGDEGNKDRTDLRAGVGTEIVAAAGGWIRYIRDHNGDTNGRGDGFAHDGTTPQDDALEHACGNNNPDPEADPPEPPNPIFGSCTQYNNYVWIEHPNGEWTKYTHFGTGTVTIDYGWTLDAWVDAGDVLGLEDDIGQATGSVPNHLHYEVARQNDPDAPTLPLTSEKTGFIDLNLAVNLVPRVCDGDGNIFLYNRGDDVTANPCDHLPPVADAGGPYFVAEGTPLDEGGTVTVIAEFTDPGFLDTHTATIDWGVPPGSEGTELGAVTVQVLDPGGPGEPLRGRVLGAYRYGDNDDGTGFTIEVTVTDSDGGSGSASFALTVNNVDPTVAIDGSGTVLLNGVPTVVTSLGDAITLGAQAEDPGSDDLTLSWDWDDGAVDSRLSLVNPPSADPLPSPTNQPRAEPDEASHTYTGACFYDVSFTALDDDGGQAGATVAVIIVGNADLIRNAGYWTSEYRFTKNPDFTPATLACYLDIANHASAVFSEQRILASYNDAVDILWVRGTSDPDELFDRQLLAAWLNFANGALALDQLVDTTGNGAADTAFHDVLMQAEALRNNPARTAAEVELMKDTLERINTAS